MSADLSQRIAVDVATAADLVGLSQTTLRGAVRGGELIAHYIGAKPVILVDELRAWIEAAPTERTP